MTEAAAPTTPAPRGAWSLRLQALQFPWLIFAGSALFVIGVNSGVSQAYDALNHEAPLIDAAHSALVLAVVTAVVFAVVAAALLGRAAGWLAIPAFAGAILDPGRVEKAFDTWGLGEDGAGQFAAPLILALVLAVPSVWCLGRAAGRGPR